MDSVFRAFKKQIILVIEKHTATANQVADTFSCPALIFFLYLYRLQKSANNRFDKRIESAASKNILLKPVYTAEKTIINA